MLLNPLPLLMFIMTSIILLFRNHELKFKNKKHNQMIKQCYVYVTINQTCTPPIPCIKSLCTVHRFPISHTKGFCSFTPIRCLLSPSHSTKKKAKAKCAPPSVNLRFQHVAHIPMFHDYSLILYKPINCFK